MDSNSRYMQPSHQNIQKSTGEIYKQYQPPPAVYFQQQQAVLTAGYQQQTKPTAVSYQQQPTPIPSVYRQQQQSTQATSLYQQQPTPSPLRYQQQPSPNYQQPPTPTTYYQHQSSVASKNYQQYSISGATFQQHVVTSTPSSYQHPSPSPETGYQERQPTPVALQQQNFQRPSVESNLQQSATRVPVYPQAQPRPIGITNQQPVYQYHIGDNLTPNVSHRGSNQCQIKQPRYRALSQSQLPVIPENKQFSNQSIQPQEEYSVGTRQPTESYTKYPPSHSQQFHRQTQNYQGAAVSQTMQSQQVYSSSPYSYQNQSLQHQVTQNNPTVSLPQHSDVNLNQQLQKNFENLAPEMLPQTNYRVQQSPQPDNNYYPYHRQILNNTSQNALYANEQQQQYTVKLSSGVIHQYPAPDYSTPSPNSTIDYNLTNTQNLYHSPISSNVYEQSNEISVAASYVSPSSSTNNSPYTPSPLSHMINKQDAEYSPQNTSLSPSYVHYRSNVTESPLGSPLNNQLPSGVFKTPQATPPLQRREPPVRQISNEIYKLDSPSNQLLLQDMSLNSPRPRSETVDMDQPPVLPPQSPAPARKDQTAEEPPILNRVIQPPNQQQDNLNPPNQRLRSGTVEMVEANVPTPNQALDSKLMPPPSAQLTMQLGLTTQRNRAGTIEMLDSSQSYNDLVPRPEQRLRSGTVEMSDAPQSIPPNQTAQLNTNIQNVSTTTDQLKPQNKYNNQVPYPQQNQSLPDAVGSHQSSTSDRNTYPHPTSVNSQSQMTNVNIQTTKVQTANQGHPQNSRLIQQNIEGKVVGQGQIPPPPNNNKHLQGTPNDHYINEQQKYQKPPPPYIDRQNVTNTNLQHDTRTNNLNISNKQVNQNVAVPANNINQHLHSNVSSTNVIMPSSQQQTAKPQIQQQHSAITQQYIPSKGVVNPQITPQQNYQSDVNTKPNKRANTQVTSQRSNILNEEIPAAVIDAYVQVYNTTAASTNETNVSPQEKPSTQYIQTTQPTNYQGAIQQQTDLRLNDYNETDLDRQQKLMQQQYVQRVRQAQLQQQLRQMQNEYQASLQIEQDVAREFLLEQEVKKENTNNSSQQMPLQQGQLYMQNIPAGYHQKPVNQPIRNPMQLPPQRHNMQQYANLQGTHGIPPVGYQPHPVMPQQPIQSQPRYIHPQSGRNNIQSQPIVIMPGGGGFSNTGQFTPRNDLPYQSTQQPLKSNLVSKQQPSPRTAGKEQTPFQKLRKIAEDISSFVDDVVKFKGKKGDQEYRYLDEMLTQQLLALDKIASIGTDELRNARKALVKEIQELLEILEKRATNQKES